MKNITLSAEEADIHQARLIAHQRKTTLNQMFRDWLHQVSLRQENLKKFNQVMSKMEKRIVFKKSFTREEMNER